MKARDLAEKLMENPDIDVIVSSDAEGNEYSGLEDVEIMYVENEYAGGRTEDVCSEEDVIDDDTDKVSVHFKPVFVLWRL